MHSTNFNMARLRFPGRPGQRYGRSLIRFMPHEAQNSQVLFFSLTANIQRNLKWFYDTFGDSDEEEDFDGFTLDDGELQAYQLLREEEALERQNLENNRRTARQSVLQPQRVHSSGRNIRNVIRRSYAAMLRGEEDLSPKLYTVRKPEELVGYGIQGEPSQSSEASSCSPSKITSIKIKLLGDGKKAKIVRQRRPPAALDLDFVRPEAGGLKGKPLTKQEKRVKMMQEKFLKDLKARERIRKRKEREKQRRQEKARKEKLKREKEKERRQQKKMREKAKKEKLRERERAKALAKKEKLQARKRGVSPSRHKLNLKSEPSELVSQVSVPANKLSNKRTDIAARQILARAKGKQRKPISDANTTTVGKRMVKKSLMLNDMVTDVHFLQRTGSPPPPSRTATSLKKPQFPKKNNRKDTAIKNKKVPPLLPLKSGLTKNQKLVRRQAASPTSPQFSDLDSDSVMSSPPSATKIAGSFYLPSFSARSSRIIKPCKRYLENDEPQFKKAPDVLSKPVSASSPREDSSAPEDPDDNSLFADVSSEDEDIDYRPGSAQTKPHFKSFGSRKKLIMAPGPTTKHKIDKKRNKQTGKNKLMHKYQNENDPRSPISSLVQSVGLKKSSKKTSSALDKRKARALQRAAFSPIRKKSETESERKPELASPVLQEVKGSHRAHLHKLAKDKRASPHSSEVKTPQHSRPAMGGDRGTHLDAVSKQMVEALEADMSPEQTADKPSKMPKVDPKVAVTTPAPRGPRIKHVCRRASVALGLEVATFPDLSMAAEHSLSALPQEERDSVNEPQPVQTELPTDGGEQEPAESPSKYSRKNRGNKYKKMRQALLEEQQDLPFRHNKKCRVAPYSGVKVGSAKRRRCGVCGPCQQKVDCGVCEFCLDKTKFGGPNTKRQACIHRKCWNPQYKSIVLKEVQEGKREPVPIPKHVRDFQPKEAGYRPRASLKATSPFKQRSSGLGKPKARIKLPTRRGTLKVFSNRPLSRAQRIQMEKEKAKLRKLEANRTSSSSLTVAKLKAKPQMEPLKINHHRINIDFKEDYDIETAWLRGIAILSSEPMVPRTVCYLCSSTGKHELIYCNICCEPFHSFCLEENERPLEGEKENWCCRRCKFCHVCGRQDKLLTCDKCHSSYHPECLGPNYPTKPSKRRKIWVCTKCVKCKSCGATTPGPAPNAQWSHDFSLCQDCGKLFDKGNYCPICSQCYEDDDYESKMMQCAECERWVHAKCEGLTDDMYHIMTDLPESVPYHCTKCQPVGPSKWQVELDEEMEAGFQNVLRAMFHCRSAAHLVNAEKKNKHSWSANRSSSPGSSSGTTRDLTASPALSDTTSVDSHSSHGESRADLISRRVSPRFLKDPKVPQGNAPSRAKDRTEAKPSGTSPVAVASSHLRNREGEGQACVEKSDKESLGDAADEVATETARDSQNGDNVKREIAMETQIEEENSANETAAGTTVSAEEMPLAEGELSSREHCESATSMDHSQAASSVLQSDQTVLEDKQKSEGIASGNRTLANEPSLIFQSPVSPRIDHHETRTVVPKSETSQEELVECQSLGGRVPESVVEDQQDGHGVMPRGPDPASDTSLAPEQVAASPDIQASQETADVTMQSPEASSKEGVLHHGTGQIPSPDQSQQNEGRNAGISETSEEVHHSKTDESADPEKANTELGPRTDSANDCKDAEAVTQSDASRPDSRESSKEQTGVPAPSDVAVKHPSSTSSSHTPENSPRIKSEVAPGDNVSPKEGTPNFEDSISSEVGVFKGLTEKPTDEVDHPKDLKAVGKRVKNKHYKTVAEFCDDCVRIIQLSLSSETEQSSNLKRNNRTACSIFLKNMTKMFPWYKVETSRSWEQNQKFPDGMLSQAVLPPHSDHMYAQWKHTNHPLPTMLQPSALKRLPFSPTNRTPARIIGGNAQVTPLTEPNTDDTRRCCLCGRLSDEDPNDGGRLLYCGQDEWIHINCGLWSAEVFEEMDGSLINVHAAIWRGRQLRCEGCSKFGATVGCCQRGCPANFHFMCAREKNCVFQEDKKVFCNTHRDKVDRDIIQDGNFAVLRRVCISLDNMKLNRNFTQGLEVSRINVMVGSLTVDDLGRLGPASDQRDALYPLEFRCQRVYWSTFEARRRCVYTIRIFEYKTVATPKSPLDVNHTTAHSPGILNKRGMGKSHAHITELGSDMPSILEMDEEGCQLGMEKTGVETMDGVFELSLDSTGLESLLDPEMLLQCEAELRDGGVDPEAVLTAALEQVDAEIAMEIDDDLPSQMQTADLGAPAPSLGILEEASENKNSPVFETGELLETFKASAEEISLTQSFPPPSTSAAAISTGLSEKTLKNMPLSAITNHSSTMLDATDGGSDLSDDLSRMVMSLNYAAQKGKIEHDKSRSLQDSVDGPRSRCDSNTSEIQIAVPAKEMILTDQLNQIPQALPNAFTPVSLESPDLILMEVNAGTSTGNASEAPSAQRMIPVCNQTHTGSEVERSNPVSQTCSSEKAPIPECPDLCASPSLTTSRGENSRLRESQGTASSHEPTGLAVNSFPVGNPPAKLNSPVEKASADTPTRSIFKFIDKLLNKSDTKDTHKFDLPSSGTPLEALNSSDIGPNGTIPGSCERQSTIRHSHYSNLALATGMRPVRTDTTVVPRDPANPVSLVNDRSDASSIDGKNDDGDLLRGFSISSGIESESDTGCLSSQESFASKIAQDTCSDEDTDMSQRTRDIVTDVIELENLRGCSAVTSTEAEALLNVAEMACQPSNLEAAPDVTVPGPVHCKQVPEGALSETAEGQDAPPDDEAKLEEDSAITPEEPSRENREEGSSEPHLKDLDEVDKAFAVRNRGGVGIKPVWSKFSDIVGVESESTGDRKTAAESAPFTQSVEVAFFETSKEPVKPSEDCSPDLETDSILSSDQGEKKDTEVDGVSPVKTANEQSSPNVTEEVAGQTGGKCSVDMEAMEKDTEVDGVSSVKTANEQSSPNVTEEAVDQTADKCSLNLEAEEKDTEVDGVSPFNTDNEQSSPKVTEEVADHTTDKCSLDMEAMEKETEVDGLSLIKTANEQSSPNVTEEVADQTSDKCSLDMEAMEEDTEVDGMSQVKTTNQQPSPNVTEEAADQTSDKYSLNLEAMEKDLEVGGVSPVMTANEQSSPNVTEEAADQTGDKYSLNLEAMEKDLEVGGVSPVKTANEQSSPNITEEVADQTSDKYSLNLEAMEKDLEVGGVSPVKTANEQSSPNVTEEAADQTGDKYSLNLEAMEKDLEVGGVSPVKTANEQSSPNVTEEAADQTGDKYSLNLEAMEKDLEVGGVSPVKTANEQSSPNITERVADQTSDKCSLDMEAMEVDVDLPTCVSTCEAMESSEASIELRASEYTVVETGNVSPESSADCVEDVQDVHVDEKQTVEEVVLLDTDLQVKGSDHKRQLHEVDGSEDDQRPESGTQENEGAEPAAKRRKIGDQVPDEDNGIVATIPTSSEAPIEHQGNTSSPSELGHILGTDKPTEDFGGETVLVSDSAAASAVESSNSVSLCIAENSVAASCEESKVEPHLEMEVDDASQSRKESDDSEGSMPVLSPMDATLDSGTCTGNESLEASTAQKTAPENQLDLTFKDTDDDVFLKSSDEGKQETDKQLGKSDQDKTTVDISTTLPKAVVILHDICKAPNNRVRSLSCTLTMETSNEVATSAPSSPKHDRGVSFFSTPTQEKSKSLPNTPSPVEGFSRQLPFLTETSAERGNVDAELLSGNFKADGGIVKEVSKSAEEEDESYDEEPLARLLQTLKDCNVQSSGDDKEQCKLIPEHSEDFVLDEKSGLFILASSASGNEERGDLPPSQSPQERKKYPMRSTFSRLTRIVENPEEWVLRRRNSSSRSSSSSSASKEKSQNPQEDEKSVTKVVATSQTPVKRGRGRPHKVQPPTELKRDNEKDLEMTQPCEASQQPKKADTDANQEGNQNESGSASKLQLKSVHRRLLISMQDKTSEGKDDMNDDAESTRSLRKRSPGVLYRDTYRMRVGPPKPRKSSRDAAETDSTGKEELKGKGELKENSAAEMEPTKQVETKQATGSVEAKTSENPDTMGKDGVDSIKPEEEGKTSSSEPVKPSRRWPLKRVTGDFVSNEALLDLWTGLQPDLGPLKQKPETPKEVGNPEESSTKTISREDENPKTSNGQSGSSVEKSPHFTRPKPSLDPVAKSVGSSSTAVATTSLGVSVLPPTAASRNDYLKCLFKTNASNQNQRVKMATNPLSLTQIPGSSECVIMSRQIVTLKPGQVLQMKKTEGQLLPALRGWGGGWGRGRGRGVGRGRGSGIQEADQTVETVFRQTTKQDPLLDKSCKVGAKPVFTISKQNVLSTIKTPQEAPKSLTAVDAAAKETEHSAGTAAKLGRHFDLTLLGKKASLKNEQGKASPVTPIVKCVRKFTTLETPKVTSSVVDILPGAPATQSLVQPFRASARTLASNMTLVTMVPVGGAQSIPIYTSLTQHSTPASTVPLSGTAGRLQGPVAAWPKMPLVSSTKIVDGPSKLHYAVSNTLDTTTVVPNNQQAVTRAYPNMLPVPPRGSMSSVQPSLNQSRTPRFRKPAPAAIMPRNVIPTCHTIVPKPTRSPLAQVMSTNSPSPFMSEGVLMTPVTTLAGSMMLPTNPFSTSPFSTSPFPMTPIPTTPSPVPVMPAQPSISLSTPRHAVDQLWSIIQQQAQQAQSLGIVPVQQPADPALGHSSTLAGIPPPATLVSGNPLKRPAPEDGSKRFGAKRRKNPLEERIWFDEFGQLHAENDLVQSSPPKQAPTREKTPKTSRQRARIKNASGPRMKMPTYTEDFQGEKVVKTTPNQPSDIRTEFRRPTSDDGHGSRGPARAPSHIPPKNPPHKEDPRSVRASAENKENFGNRGSPPSPVQVQANDGFKLLFEVKSDDGFETRAETMEEAWRQVVEKVQERRNDTRMKSMSFAGMDPMKMLGIKHDALVFLIEQLFGAKNCKRYQFKFHQRHAEAATEEEPPLNPHGCARAEPFKSRSHHDIFDFLASRHRKRPELEEDTQEQDVQHKSSKRATSLDLPMAMRFRHLKETAKEAVGVYRSSIHGRGLFCKRPIEASEMVIEYSGTVIRSMLTDKREKYYESKGIGCYMFRIDDFDVVDATIHGNAARFINHSCDPNCFSRVIQVDGKKHIVIFASRKIHKGEELTYDYKFPIEDVKLPCNCGAMRCRKYLN